MIRLLSRVLYQTNKRNLWEILLDHFKPLKTKDAGYCYDHDYHWGKKANQVINWYETWPVPNFDPQSLQDLDGRFQPQCRTSNGCSIEHHTKLFKRGETPALIDSDDSSSSQNMEVWRSQPTAIISHHHVDVERTPPEVVWTGLWSAWWTARAVQSPAVEPEWNPAFWIPRGWVKAGSRIGGSDQILADSPSDLTS